MGDSDLGRDSDVSGQLVSEAYDFSSSCTEY